MITGTPEPDGTAVKLDTTLYLPDTTPAPAVLLAQGFGGDKTDLAGTAQTLAQHGYVVLAYTARGFGNSGGLIHFDSPRYEVHDAKLLVDYLTTLPQVDKTQDRRRRQFVRRRARAAARRATTSASRRSPPTSPGTTSRTRCSPTRRATVPACSRSCGRARCSATRSRRTSAA